uniref:Uncharacterized protein n=1 Tax=Chromera velia CCMP2878 TaxID=1169474 RepID=A0A0G4I8M8_9ALVE|mmetsp:Transcript_37864/g.74465  ORF Transcript_37864/g.74465 Transcript_37864/m.74465 type:complete len:342 (-) Transcript_37864:134-1159(-)|eukprot:Cvel_11991.t1-p1 / transcript=Cvel_11991.t1 / gene=Cvel_11991 / organism=Chromera_velia_CCMP2878 / gene_product=U5 small nuclear ribonucleoprotein 40 kDa protein, putative / transcript_product=U5 small nuclear ribonucleoprotein 40 kDa protein, putative / location=Cvel_scaffold769:27250-32036(-) / protein_length=341 / sequence_SO=supercontig / SO=protein_coding / is_pseudo=false
MALVAVPSDPAQQQLQVAEGAAAAAAQVPRKSGLQAPTMLLTGHKGEVFSLEFSPDGRNVVSGSFDKQIFLWSVYGDCENWGTFSGHQNAVLQTRWSADGTQVYSCSADKSCCVWDIDKAARVKKFSGHQGVVNSIAVSRRGSPLLTSGADDGTTKLWDLRTRKCVRTFEHSYQILSVCFDDTAERIFAGSLDDTIRVFDIRRGEEDEEMTLEGHADSVTGIDLSADGTRLASTSMDNTVAVWDVQQFCNAESRCIGVLQGASHNFEKNLLRVRWGMKDKMLAAASADRQMYIWNMHDDGKLMYRLPGHMGSVNDVAFHPEEPIVGSCSSDRRIFLGELSD